VINAKLEDAIAIGPHLAEVRQASSKERSNGKGNQGDAANSPPLESPAVEHWQFVVRLHGSFSFVRLCEQTLTRPR
jgi:hypothetical protein